MRYRVNGDSTVTIAQRCPFCGHTGAVDVPASGFKTYQMGATVQRAFPEASAVVREFIITGMCPRCQATVFGEDD